jgi:hypothetical protein
VGQVPQHSLNFGLRNLFAVRHSQLERPDVQNEVVAGVGVGKQLQAVLGDDVREGIDLGDGVV